MDDFIKNGLSPSLLKKNLKYLTETEYKNIFRAIHITKMANPTTSSVLTVGEEPLSKSIQRMGDVDFFSVITRKPRICDHKPIVVETAIARLLKKSQENESTSIRLMRFANRVPLQFDKSACAITKAVESVNWKAYGLAQQKNSLPLGPYVFAVSVTSPFIKFKNASKETIDANEDLVEEIRRTLMQTGQKLARHIKKEKKADDLERKTQYIKQFVPILVKKLGDITKANNKRLERAEKGIMKLLGQDTKEAEEALKTAESRLQQDTEKTEERKLQQDTEKTEETEERRLQQDTEKTEENKLKEDKEKVMENKKRIQNKEQKTGSKKKKE